MALTRQERLRLDELRATPHRSLAMYALELEGRLGRWRDLQASLSLIPLLIAAAIGYGLCWLV